MQFEGPLTMENWLTQCAPPSPPWDPTQYEKQWPFFFVHLDSCFRKSDTLLEGFQWGQTILLEIYRTLMILESHWQELGIHIVSERTGEEGPLDTETLNLFEHLLHQVRTLLLLTSQSSASESVSSAFLFQKTFLDIGVRRMGKVKEKQVSQPTIEVSNPSISENTKSIPAKKGTKHEKPN